jgi:hypothetical protein
MSPLHVSHDAPHRSPGLRNDPRTPTDGLIVEHVHDELASRHEPLTLTERAERADPYAEWLKEQEVERRAASRIATPSPARPFRRYQRDKAPWEAISVRLSPDGP